MNTHLRQLLMVINLILILIVNIFAQENKPCSSDENKQFDFWVGEWDLTWISKEGKESKGTNRIEKIFKDCIIEENFDGSPGMIFQGKSVSAFNQKSKQWQQTWVDDQGGYLDFKGQFIEDKMILSRETTLKDKKITQRMVWYNIEKNQFDWNWERSDDGGKSWKVLWKIHYKRQM